MHSSTSGLGAKDGGSGEGRGEPEHLVHCCCIASESAAIEC